MLKSKKIMSSVFPKLQPLPDEYLHQCAEKANDGKILFVPSSRKMSGKAAYYCLKCGTAGEVDGDFPVCEKCGNTEFRPAISHRYDFDNVEKIRLVQRVDNYVVISEIECKIEESPFDGIKVKAEDQFRIVLSDSDYGIFGCGTRYQGGETKHVWGSVKEVCDYKNTHPHLVVMDDSVYENPLLKKLEEDLDLPIMVFAEEVMLSAVGEVEHNAVLPNVEFPDIDSSIIKGVQVRWEPVVRVQPVEQSDGFVMVESWCPSCGKYHKRLEKAEDSYSTKGCKFCGYQGRYHLQDKEFLFHLIDAVETENGEIILRVHGIVKELLIAEEVVPGEDPTVIHHLLKKFVNYIHIDSQGKPHFFDADKKEIDKLQVKVCETRNTRHQHFIYSEQAKELIKNNKGIKRTGFDLLVDTNTTPKFFEYLVQIPSLEIFAKSKMFILIQDILRKEIQSLPAFIRGTSKQKSLSNLSKPQLESLRSQFVTMKHLDAYLQCLNKDPTALFEDFVGLSTLAHERHVLDILRVGVPGLTVKKIAEYITRVDDVQCCPPSDSMQLWADYLRMLRDSECDLTDSKLVYTHSLKREHDKVARKLTQINDEKLVKAFEQKASDNEWLEYKGKQLSAIVPHNLSELYEEGRKLSHCVGTYARSVVNGNSIIVFLRKNTKLGVPYCTVEVRGKKIVQVRGWDNREGAHVPDINSFLKVWSEKKGLELMVA